MSARKKKEEKVRLRLKVKSYDYRLIDSSVKSIIDTATRNGAEIVGPIPLPTEIKRWTVNRSTFVHKKARDQFELRIHKRLIDILNPNQKIVESLSNLNLPIGVEVELKFKQEK